MPKDRHKGTTRIQAWLHHYPSDEFSRFERLTPNCKTHKEAILKLMDFAEKYLAMPKQENQEIRTLKSQNQKLIDDLKKADRRIEELEEQSELSKVQPQPKIESQDGITEKPQYMERTTEKVVEKIVYRDLITLSIPCSQKGYANYMEDCPKCPDKYRCIDYSTIRDTGKLFPGVKISIKKS